MSSLELESFQSSILPKVVFVNLTEQHSLDDDLICQYRLEGREVEEGDRIAIFKLGWQFLKDYVLFEWAPVNSNTVIFKEESLPKDVNEIYQLCYITGENAVLGVSTPIQFCKNSTSMFQSQSTRDSVISSCNSRTSTISIPNLTTDTDYLVSELRKENDMLKETLKVVVASNKITKFEKEMNDLKIVVKYLQETVINQQREIENLRKSLSEHTNICQNSHRNNSSIDVRKSNLSGNDFDLGELPSIPPLPLPK